MPREGYITKQDLQFDAMQAPLQQEQEQGEEWKAYHKLTSDSKNLTENRRTAYFSSKTVEDSAAMTQVKEALDAVTSFYTQKEIPADEEAFAAQLSELQKLYGTLRRHCERYLAEKKGGLKRIYKGEGYRRYQMVKKAHTKASVELAVLEGRAKQVFESFRDNENEAERPLWVNVLAEARTRHLDLQRGEAGSVTYTGGNTSNVIKLTAPTGEVAYIKKNENNVPLGQAIESYIREYMESGEVREMLETDEKPETIRAYLSFLGKQLGGPGPIHQYFLVSGKVKAPDFASGRVTPDLFAQALEQVHKPIPREIQQFFHTPYAARILKNFGAFIFRHDTSYSAAYEIAKIEKNSSITDRNVATYRMAELLGIQDLVPATQRVVYLDKDGKRNQGILMAEAKGKELWEAGNEVLRDERMDSADPVTLDKGIYLQLNSLQILDTITGQIDRHNANVMMEYQGKKIVKIKGIDNDMCFGKLTYKEITNPKERVGEMKPLEENGNSQLLYIDRKVYDSVLALQDEMVTYVFADLLKKKEMTALLDRIHGVQKFFRSIRIGESKVRIVDAEKMSSLDATQIKLRQRRCYTNLLR